MEGQFSYEGVCTCQLTRLQLRLPQPIQSYTPRICDCDFCTSRGIQYLSDPDGEASICCPRSLSVQRQGSMQAEFLTCPECGDVLAASMIIHKQRRASVNVKLFAAQETIRPGQAASPKRLNAQDKVSRWEIIWMPLDLN